MHVLAIDTSQPVGSVAVSARGTPVRAILLESVSSHLVELGTAVDSLLDEMGLSVNDIDRLALVSGPGSFTGLRIGMAYAKGLHAGLGIEMVVITSLQLLAAQSVRGRLPISPMIDARKDEVYAALYRPVEGGKSGNDGSAAPPSGVREVISPRALPPGEHVARVGTLPTVFVGSGALRYRAQIESAFGKNAVFPSEDCHRPSTEVLCEIAPRLGPLGPKEIIALEPFYIRPSDAKLKPLREIRAHD